MGSGDVAYPAHGGVAVRHNSIQTVAQPAVRCGLGLRADRVKEPERKLERLLVALAHGDLLEGDRLVEESSDAEAHCGCRQLGLKLPNLRLRPTHCWYSDE